MIILLEGNLIRLLLIVPRKLNFETEYRIKRLKLGNWLNCEGKSRNHFESHFEKKETDVNDISKLD